MSKKRINKETQERIQESGRQALEDKPIEKKLRAELLKVNEQLEREKRERERIETRFSSFLRFQNEILDNTSVWINTLDSEGNVTFWNSAAETISGYSREEVVGHKKIWEWVYPDPDERHRFFSKSVEAVRQDERTENLETIIRCKDGGEKVMSWYHNRFFHEDEEIFGSINLGADVTDRKRVEEEIQKSHKLLEKIFASLNDAVLVIDDEKFEIIDCNAAAEKMFRYNKEELLGLMPDFLHAQNISKDAMKSQIYQAVSERGYFHLPDIELIRKDGTPISVELRLTPLEAEADRHIGWVSVTRDITEHKQEKEILQRYLKRVQILTQAGRGVLEARSTEHITQEALQELTKLVPSTLASVIMFEFDLHEAFILAAHLPQGIKVPSEARFSLCGIEGFLEKLRQGRVQLVRDILSAFQDPPTVLTLSTDTIRSVICAPLFSEDKLIGILNVGNEKPWAYTREHSEVVREVADVLAVAIENARLLRSIIEQRETIRSMAARVAETQELERRRLSQELHDLVGQNLSALSINLSLARAKLPAEASEKVSERINDSLRLVEQTTTHIRDVMAELRPPVLDDYGLVAALRWYGDQFSQRTGINTFVRGGDLAFRLPSNVETTLFRIALEALTNVAKYAKANQVIVTLDEKDDLIRLSIADDGVGFNQEALLSNKKPTGWGQVIMRERAIAIGGELHVDTEPDKGTSIVVELRRESYDH